MKKIFAALAATSLACGIAAATTTAQATPTKAAAQTGVAAPGEYVPPPIMWGPCDNPTLQAYGSECGMLTVPMDYANPGGTKIKLAVSRLKHKTATSQGVMIVNPGGPGGSGLIYSVLQGAPPRNSGLSYDWIGFDPRGVGSSVPSLACNANFFHGNRAPYRPTTNSIYQNWLTRSKDYAADCQSAKNSALFNHVKTTDSVADLESLRIALGQSKINYYGFSYGTYLGQVYATEHPDRVRRFVWDGTVDPQRVFYLSNQDQDRAFQRTFDIYFRWLAKYSSVYDVGDTYSQVRNTFLRTQADLDKSGNAAGGVLGGDELIDVFTSAGYYVYGWEDIAAAYSKYLHTGDASDLIDMFTSANDTSPGGDNGYAMYLGTQCTDAPWPTDQSRLNEDNWRLDTTYNYFTWSNAWFNGPCAYWKYPAHNRVTVSGSAVKVPILMIGETFDAATPFPGSLVVRKLFPTASLIEGVNGSTHAGSLSGVACTDNAIAAYLSTGVVPGRKTGDRSDKLCSPVPQPDPTSATAARSGGKQTALQKILHTSLAAAQQH